MPEFKDKAEFEDVVVKYETPDALLCVIDGDEHWVPKSHIDDDSEVYKSNTEGTLIVSRWIAEKKGLV